MRKKKNLNYTACRDPTEEETIHCFLLDLFIYGFFGETHKLHVYAERLEFIDYLNPPEERSRSNAN